jgi:hypothetical protein
MLTLTMVLIGVAMVVGSVALVGLCVLQEPTPAGGRWTPSPKGKKFEGASHFAPFHDSTEVHTPRNRQPARALVAREHQKGCARVTARGRPRRQRCGASGRRGAWNDRMLAVSCLARLLGAFCNVPTTKVQKGGNHGKCLETVGSPRSLRQ